MLSLFSMLIWVKTGSRFHGSNYPLDKLNHREIFVPAVISIPFPALCWPLSGRINIPSEIFIFLPLNETALNVYQFLPIAYRGLLAFFIIRITAFYTYRIINHPVWKFLLLLIILCFMKLYPMESSCSLQERSLYS